MLLHLLHLILILHLLLHGRNVLLEAIIDGLAAHASEMIHYLAISTL
jgi:hypothetical protein